MVFNLVSETGTNSFLTAPFITASLMSASSNTKKTENMRSNQELGVEGAQWTTPTDGDEEDTESRSDGTIELGPARSQNGHGCADLSDKDENAEKNDSDAFEVSFDGDDDPMCPRSSE